MHVSLGAECQTPRGPGGSYGVFPPPGLGGDPGGGLARARGYVPELSSWFLLLFPARPHCVCPLENARMGGIARMFGVFCAVC